MTNTLLSALVNGAIAAALLAAAVRLSLLLAPRTILSAAARYVIWWTILVSTLLLPLAYLPRRPLDATVHLAARIDQMPPAPGASAPAAPPLPLIRRPVRAVGLSLPLLVTADGAPRWLLIGWVSLSALSLLRLLASLCLFARRRSGAVPAPAELARSVEASLLAHRSPRRAVVLMSPTIAAPVLVGLHRPTILIPERLLAELSESELIAVALHEAAHVARRDDYALLAERLVQSVLPLHPVAWWIFRQIGLEREIACDAFAVETFGSPRDYAACLVRVMELCSGARVSWAAAGMAAGRSQLAHRVNTLLAAGRQSPNRPRKLRLLTAVAIVVALACFAVRTPDAVAFSTPPTPQQPPSRVRSDGIEVNVLETSSAQETSKDLPVISIQKDGETYLNDKPCNIHDLGAVIRQKFGKPDAVYVRADKETIYDVIAKVCDQLRNDGLKIYLVTQPVESLRRGKRAVAFSTPPTPQQPPLSGVTPPTIATAAPTAPAEVSTRPAKPQGSPASSKAAAKNPPLSVLLVVDRSGSMGNKSSLVDTAITALTKSADPADEFLLVAFNNVVDVAGPFTNDGTQILQQLHRDMPRGGTSVRDAVLRAIRWNGTRYPNRVLIVISDGDDNSSSISGAQLSETVIPAHVPVWAITLTATRPRGSRWLGDLASRSGGREFVTDDPNDVAAIAGQLLRATQ